MDEISTTASRQQASRLCQTSIILRQESPQIVLSSNSQFPKTLDKLKIRKRVQFFPIRVTLKADYETKNRAFSYGCSVKVRDMWNKCQDLDTYDVSTLLMMFVSVL